MTRSILSAALLAAVVAVPVQAQESLRTHHEQSGFTEYTPYESMMEYLHAVRAESSEMTLTTYGQTFEGRDLPLAIFSQPRVTQPWEAWSLGKPIISFNANVHGNERTLRESLLTLIRELATDGSEANALLDDVVILVVPQINPDGFEAPQGSTRGNSWGIDMNRDWVKLEQAALTAYSTNVIGEWRPHLFVDGHNGGLRPYSLTYQCPSHAAPDQRITELCDDEIFPAIDARLEAEGMDTWYYQVGRPTRTEWPSGGSDPRIGRNYGGLANSVAILFESPPGTPMEEGWHAGVLGYKAVAEWSRDNADLLMETIRRARVETIEMGTTLTDPIPTAQEYGPEPETVSYRFYEGSRDNPTLVETDEGRLIKRPIVTASRPRPYAYLLPRQAIDAVAMLRRHGITVEKLTAPITLTVDAYELASVTRERAYDHAGAARVEIAGVTTITEEFPAGTYVVQTSQMMGRVVGHMLEPETSDNVVYWNTMDAWLPESQLANADSSRPALIPIFKLMVEQPLPAIMIR